MSKLFPPICLLLALLMFVAGFALMAIDQPQASIELHRARIDDDDQYRDLLEERLRERQLRRTILIGTLFGTGVLSVVVAFLAMRPPRPTNSR